MAKPSFPKSKNERAYAHLQVLFEINARLQIIESVKQINAPFGIAREICYLQLRHICELVAIGSVIVQGDYTSSPDFTGEYAPSKVFKSLDKHYPGSFPQTLVIEKGENGIQFKCNVSRNEMTRKEMEELWGRTGNFLHRLKLKNFFREETELNIWPEIDQHTAKLKALLNPMLLRCTNRKSWFVPAYTEMEGTQTWHFWNTRQTALWKCTNSKGAAKPLFGAVI